MSGQKGEGASASSPTVRVLVVQSVWGYNRTQFDVSPELAARLKKAEQDDFDDEAWEELWGLDPVKFDWSEEGDNGYLEVFDEKDLG